ncbi:cell division protein ZapA [Aquimarina agarivorans]|uniref:cell division protein ZapA n=1 Tax=Aquimarina agarivorans TaxID=980584 RepID=UPI000248E7A5|nr:cell division protein ZapA [Aquimarina agarivorans]
MADRLKIKLSIADRVYPMTAMPEEEEGLRIAAKKINQLIKQFEQNYAVRDKQDVLAMCALQFASLTEQKSINKEKDITKSVDRLRNLIDRVDLVLSERS